MSFTSEGSESSTKWVEPFLAIENKGFWTDSLGKRTWANRAVASGLSIAAAAASRSTKSSEVGWKLVPAAGKDGRCASA